MVDATFMANTERNLYSPADTADILAARIRFTSTELSKVTGATPREIQRWSEIELLRPLIRRHKRWFDRRDMMATLIAKAMRERQIGSGHIRRVLRLAEEAIERALENGEPLVVMVPFRKLMPNKNAAYGRPEVLERDLVIAWLKRSVGFGSFLIPLDELARRVHAGVSSRAGLPEAQSPEASAPAAPAPRSPGAAPENPR
jgi:DNA-binding transcriptional MerR regulator